MSKLTQEQINHIRNSVDIVDVVSEYIPLSKKGKNFFGVCPFHDDSDPSLSVSKEKQIYTCFSCGATGNVINFIMDFDQITFMESMKFLAEKAAIDIQIDDVKTVKKDQELYDIYEISQKFYLNNISSEYGLKAIEYLNNRNLTKDIIGEFEIGLSVREKSMLSNLLIKKNFKEEDIIKAGIANKSEYGLNDVFYNRIMFPLHDSYGKIIGYSGRIYDNYDTAKYVNTKETNIFKKGEILYHYHKAKESCRISKQVIILEGFMDVIRLSSVGIKNTVATMGTAVTKKQAMLIKKIASEVIICFDGDQAGKKATLACSEELLNIGITPKVVRLPDNLDPDEYILKYGKDSFLDHINNAISIMDFKMDYFKKDLNLTDSNDLAKYVNTIIDELNKIDDDVLREITIHKISEESKLDIKFLKAKLKDSTAKPIIKKELVKTDKYNLAEKYLIYYMLRSNDVIKMYRKRVTYMPTYECRLLAIEISEFLEKYKSFSLADLYTVIGENQKLIRLLGEINSLDLKEEFTFDEIDDYINVIADYNTNGERKKLTDKLKQAITTEEKLLIAEKIRKLKVED